MNRILLTKDNDGDMCIRINNDASALELQNLCKKIESGLTEKGYIVGSVDLIINDQFVTISIEMLDSDYDKIGLVEYSTNEQNGDYYDLFPIKTSTSNKCYQNKWDEYMSNIVDDVFDIMSK